MPNRLIQQRSAALQEYITTREVGESSGTALQGQAEHTQINAMEAQRSYQQGSGINPNQPTLLADPTASQQDHGVKRKTMEDTKASGSSGGAAFFLDDRVKISFLDNPKLEQWYDMMRSESAGFLHNKPRILIGDFNDIKGRKEKQGGLNKSSNRYGAKTVQT
ncbi:hypothetical protein DY000_02054846 [Brassica cretica]|uniref:Endonuclease/exonuclease/phosphatase domain-containing protein n=1 Tax=Brassica cretica TaxID=69181 RepID=A0ABQ7AHV1_BRACR|nr:hypothetical protein DY000_02054846 [Brassica cretica]